MHLKKKKTEVDTDVAVRWPDESSFMRLVRGGGLHEWRGGPALQEDDPAALVFCWGVFCGHCLTPLVPSERRVTANQYRVALSDHLYPVMEQVYPDGSCHLLGRGSQ